MASLRRKPRAPFPYVLKADRTLPEAEQPRFIVAPPTDRQWGEIVDTTKGQEGALFEAVARCVDRLENHPDADDFGAADTEKRRMFLDTMGILELRELGNVVAETLLTETDRKN